MKPLALVFTLITKAEEFRHHLTIAKFIAQAAYYYLVCKI